MGVKILAHSEATPPKLKLQIAYDTVNLYCFFSYISLTILQKVALLFLREQCFQSKNLNIL